MLKKGIKTRLIVNLVIALLLVMSVFSLLLHSYLKDFSGKELEKTIGFLGRNATSLLGFTLFNDYNQLENIVRPIILEDFDYLVIFDNMTDSIAFKEDPRAVTDGIRLTELAGSLIPVEKQELNIRGEKYTQYIFPVKPRQVRRPLGYLVIGVSARRLKAKMAGITSRVLSISVLLFLTLTLLIYFLSDKIVKPIKELTAKIGKFASGDYSVRSNIRTRDEIRQLSDNFNFMADKINEQILSIEENSKNLEKKVEERTDELLKAMDAIKEKDKRLNKAEKINSLNSIVSSIAHEINNPLTIISGNLQLLMARSPEEIFKKKLQVADVAIQRIANLIHEINFFSTIKDITTTPIEFSGFLSGIVNQVVPGDISIIIDGGRDDRIHSNINLLTVSLENILTNSVEWIRHRQVEGKIHIRYFKDGPLFVVETTDNAGGIDNPDRAFEPFYTTFHQKKGLGLTFVYHAIQALCGDVEVENVDKGTKLTLLLPQENI